MGPEATPSFAYFAACARLARWLGCRCENITHMRVRRRMPVDVAAVAAAALDAVVGRSCTLSMADL